MDHQSIKASIQAKAKDLGFSFISFSQPKQTPHNKKYREWISSGMNGSMKYLEQEYVIRSRRQPKILLKGAKSVISFGQHYHLFNHSKSTNKDFGVIASYARFPDYHHELKQKAGDLVAHIESLLGHQIVSKVFVDSSQMMEKDFAYLSGAGWIGKNSLLIVPPYGSNWMIGCIMTNLPLADEQAELHQDLCQDCRKCIDACPTQCIQENRTIDARKCIAYLTIEYKGIIPRPLRVLMGNHIFGCDQCQIVCPLNGQFNEFYESDLAQNKKIINGTINFFDALSLTKESYIKKFEKTPIIRATYDMFMRNILIAIGNSEASQYSNIIKILFENSDSTLIRSHAVWALGMVDPSNAKPYFQKVINNESDENVKEEIFFLINKRLR